MDLQAFTSFFMWCSIINGGLLLFWSVFCLFAMDWVYRTQSRVFPLPRETFDIIMYAFLGAFKLAFLIFNLVPYVALRIIG